MTWALWLSVPVAATVLAACWTWLRGWRIRRAARPLDAAAAMRAHDEYLAALALPARSRERATAVRPLDPPPSTSRPDGTDTLAR